MLKNYKNVGSYQDFCVSLAGMLGALGGDGGEISLPFAYTNCRGRGWAQKDSTSQNFRVSSTDMLGALGRTTSHRPSGLATSSRD